MELPKFFSSFGVSKGVPEWIYVDFSGILGGFLADSYFCWIFAWNEYLFANLLTGTTVKTFPVHIPSFTQGSQTLWNLVMAFSMVAMIPPVGMFIILRKYMVRGLSLGVVKG